MRIINRYPGPALALLLAAIRSSIRLTENPADKVLPSLGQMLSTMADYAFVPDKAIEVEVWDMAEEAFGSFVAEVPAPLSIGTVKLADGRAVKGFLCEAFGAAGAEDITVFGGWRAWLERGQSGSQPVAV